MRIVGGILLLVAGVVFPMALVAWLSSRLNRQPRPAPRQIGLVLALNGLLPVGLVLLGLGLMAPQLWAMVWLRWAALAAWLAVGVVVVALIVSGRTGPGRGRDG